MTQWIKINKHLLVGKNPVTVREYKKFIESGGYFSKDFFSEKGWQWKESHGFVRPSYWGEEGYTNPEFPVTGISFFEAEAFANFSGAQLPNELIWEYVATNQGKSQFPWGDSSDNLEERAHLSFFGEFAERGVASVLSHPAGQSELGVVDLIGNVSEWCLPNASNELLSKVAVLRGGSHWHIPESVDAFFRVPTYAGTRDNQTGIRLVQWDGNSLDYKLREGGDLRIGKPIQRPTKPFRQEGIPEVLADSYRLRITGKVEKEVNLSLQNLQTQFSTIEQSGLYVCVCNWADNNVVRGVALKDVVEYVKPTVPLNDLYIRQKSLPGERGRIYDASIPVAQALEHNTILCWEIDGKPLTPELGFPLRLVDFQLYGYKQVKALGELHFTYKFEPGWWETEKGYDVDGKIQPGSVTIIGEMPYKTDLG